MANENSRVKTIVQVLHDGHKGFADIGDHLKDPQIKAHFPSESKTRASFAGEIESAAGFDQSVGGTASGAVHRTWGDIKAHLGGGDDTLLETAEQGEDAAKKAYKEALEDPEVAGTLRQLIERQHGHIQASHDKVKAFRDRTRP